MPLLLVRGLLGTGVHGLGVARDSVSLYDSEWWHVSAVGKVVFVQAADVILDADSWASVTCPFTIPEGYRPGFRKLAACTINNSSPTSSVLWVEPSGTVTVRNLGGAGARGGRYGTLSYPIGL